ncbi:MAG: hypothetical protein ACQET6_02445 [Bacillota bacterium]
MRNYEYRNESIACYLFCSLFLLSFVGTILVSGELSGNSIISSVPNFSWDMMIKWK